MSKTCSACRSKKIKCDGAFPICRACTKTRKPVECSYTALTAPRVPKPDLLQKGAACTPCRQKKKKCDAKRPCLTCIAADKEADCQYKEDRPNFKRLPSRRTHIHRPSSETFDNLSGTGEILDITYAAMEQLDLSGEFYLHPLGSTESSSSTSSSSSMTYFDFSAMLDFGTDTSSKPSHFPSPLVGHSETSSDKSSLPLDSTVNRAADSNGDPMSDSLSSYTFPRETLLLFRTVFLAHQTQLGLSLPPAKLNALRREDMTGHIVDPILVHIAHMWGCFLCHFSDSEESIHLQATINILNNDDAKLTMTTSIQAHSLVALYFLAKGEMYRGREYLLKASNVVMKNDLHIVSPTEVTRSGDSGRSLMQVKEAEASDEQLVALCQLVYLDKCADLVLRFPTLFPSEMDQELEILPNINAAVCSASFIVQRTRSVCYVQQAKSLAIAWIPDETYDMASSSWYQKYWELLRLIHLHQGDVKPAMLQASYSFDRELNIAFKLCHILTLTALAYLYDVLSTKHPESRRSCFDTVVEIVHVTGAIADEDYPLIDPVITIGWIFAADVLNKECQLNDFGISPEQDPRSLLLILHQCAQKLKRVVPYVSDIMVP